MADFDEDERDTVIPEEPDDHAEMTNEKLLEAISNVIDARVQKLEKMVEKCFYEASASHVAVDKLCAELAAIEQRVARIERELGLPRPTG